MKHFEKTEFTFFGKTVVVPAEKILRLLSVIEINMDVVSISRCKIVPVCTMTIGYTPVLQYLGFDVTEEDVMIHFSSNHDECYKAFGHVCELLNYLTIKSDDLGDPVADQDAIDSQEKK